MQRLSTTNPKLSQQAQQQALQVSSTASQIERTIHFSQAQAIVWQIKFILNQINSKKALTQASNEIESLSSKFGKDFDKYLLKELIEQIDLKDPVKAQKDKNEVHKVALLTQEFLRCMLKPDFLQYLGEIAQQGFEGRLADFVAELTRRLKLTQANQIIVALSLAESCKDDSEAIKILKQKLLDYYHSGRPEPLPEYALHKLLFLYSTHLEMSQDENRENVQQYLIDSNTLKYGSHISLRCILQQDLMFANTSTEDPSYCLFKDGQGLDNLDKSYRMLEPWQLLVDLGHMSSYNYNYLLKTLDDFKDINERTMARTLIHLSINHTGCDDQSSKIAQNSFEANKKGDSSILRKEVTDKKNQLTWSVDNLSRAFRELYSHLNWQKVFEALSEISDDIYLDSKAFSTFLQILNKSKPQNHPYPINFILQTQWASPLLQISFIENSMQFYIEKKDKSINFTKAGDRRQEMIEELTAIKEKVPIEFLQIWLSVDLVERLLVLSDSHNFQKVRQLFEAPLKQVPEYMLLTLSLCKLSRGCLMIDELLSLLLPQFLGNHINSIIVLQALWRNNQALMIRAMCELCRHDQRIMNLSRVLDITQEVKESLMPIVDCEDYYFAVNLAILAGKRDFLHYDVWLQRRITDVGTPFIKALLKYIKEHIISPITEFQRRGTVGPQGQVLELTADQIELQKSTILDKSHLSKEKLCITIENLSNPAFQNNPLVKPETKGQIREVIARLGVLFPNQFVTSQNSEEIDNAANDYFQKVFSAEPHQVDQKISELIDTMQKFRTSENKKDQEIYACMLHSLFDEYRFLHKYPNLYLEKIAKLYGAIIKNRIIDGTLQDIALKFVLEAFRRDGKRLKFGVIVIRHILEMLPTFPQYFDEIFELRHNIATTDPGLIKEIEDLYHKSAPNTRTRAPSGPLEESSKFDEQVSSRFKSQLSNMSVGSDSYDDKKEESKMRLGQSFIHEKVPQNEQSSLLPQLPKFNDTDFQKTVTQSHGNQIVQPTTQPKKETGQTAGQKGTHAQQKGSTEQAPQTKGGLTASSTQAPVFNPTYKVRQQDSALHSTQSQTSAPLGISASEVVASLSTVTTQPSAPLGQGLNPSSVAFSRRPAAQQQPVVTVPQPSTALTMTSSAPSAFPVPLQPVQAVPPQIQPPTVTGGMSAANVRPFRPPAKATTPLPAPTFNQQAYQMQMTLDQKLQKAISENAKVKLEDVIEDSNMPGPSPEIQEEIKFICNNTGKQNLNQKLEQLKGIIAQNSQVNLNWFIHFILTKRISQQGLNLFPLYIEMIKQAGPKDSVVQAIAQIVEIFKKCMLVNEDDLNKVASRAQQQMSLIKQYLINLGTFLGLMTVAGNRPLYAREMDIKQLLIEGFTSDKMKYVVSFVCRFLKECPKSPIFKHQNPWVKANLEILKEIYEFALSKNNQFSDVIMEIDSLFKVFGINHMSEITSTGFLKAAIYQQFNSQSQQVEVSHLNNKAKLIPAVQPAAPFEQYPRPASGQQYPAGAFNMQASRMMQGQRNEFEQQQKQMITSIQQIFQKVVISPEFLSMLGLPSGKTQQIDNQLLRKIVADAVDQSIVEILPPVVDRSVTIALITTRELVLKDFAFDADFSKILKAADLIVQNLAGSLALVTCREPLKMQLTTNLKKSMTQQLLPVLQADGDQSLISEPLLTEMAQQASKDNLELGCKLIKKAVIQKALTKVREDLQITRAIELRQASLNPAEFKRNALQDEAMIAQFADLPQQLKPNPDGLTDAQFQVYEDFTRLNKLSMNYGGSSGAASTLVSESGSLKSGELQSDDDIETYLKQYETLTSFDKKFELTFTIKLQSMSQKPELYGDQIKKLIQFCENLFFSVCERLAAQSQQQVQASQDKTGKILDFLAFVTSNFKVGSEDMQKRLTQQFLSFDASSVNNASLTLNLMKRGILSTSKWDSQIASVVRDSQQFTSSLSNAIYKEQKELFAFLREFFEAAILGGGPKDFTYQSFPNVMLVIQKLSENDEQIAKFFGTILLDYKQRATWTKETLRDYFNEWAVISFEEASHPQRQEQEVNRFFNNLKSHGLYKDVKVMQKFCKAMVELSVERALYLSDGVTKRPADRLVYRYIESFLNLLVVSLMNFTSPNDGMNKHEFLAQLFEAIHQVLDEDHRTKKGEFNQKPYYRLLINILRVVSNPATFNSKTHLQVLFSLADLFNKLNPKEYPAFSFAWLELISHKTFMPNFLQIPQGQQQPQLTGLNQPKRPQVSGPPQALVQADTTYFQKWFTYKDLIVHLFTFLKWNMVLGQPMSEPLSKFYEATLRIIVVIKNDYPEFLCDFHFNLVNSLPDHCIQLRNIILSAQPRNIPYIDPFSKNLKVDTLPEINQPPRSQSNYENYLVFMNLREDLERYFRTKEKSLIQVIADKMMQSEEIINGRKRINSYIFNAVALFIQNCAHQNKSKLQTVQKECYEMLKQIILILSPETRLCLLNAIVNELRYINCHTYFYSWMVIYLFGDIDETVQEQISRILIERLQSFEPHPWGLCITFRELLQNPKYNFAKKSFVVRHQAVIEQLMQTKLSNFYSFWANNRQVLQQIGASNSYQQDNA